MFTLNPFCFTFLRLVGFATSVKHLTFSWIDSICFCGTSESETVKITMEGAHITRQIHHDPTNSVAVGPLWTRLHWHQGVQDLMASVQDWSAKEKAGNGSCLRKVWNDIKKIQVSKLTFSEHGYFFLVWARNGMFKGCPWLSLWRCWNFSETSPTSVNAPVNIPQNSRNGIFQYGLYSFLYFPHKGGSHPQPQTSQVASHHEARGPKPMPSWEPYTPPGANL